MRRLIARLTGSGPPAEHAPQGAKGKRAYAIGDVHGRLDLLEELLARIEADAGGRSRDTTFLVFMGDLIDRGDDSAGVLELLRGAGFSWARPVFLMGNHEEVMLRALGDEPELIADWFSFGGYECAQSYGVPVGTLLGAEPRVAQAALLRGIPAAHVEFVRDFIDTFRFGDYLFVHAGIRPGRPIEDQQQHDLRWIREHFLGSREQHGVVVVHGHTIVAEAEDHGNRIAIDTGAYRTGRLTALVLEGSERRYIVVDERAGDASAAVRGGTGRA